MKTWLLKLREQVLNKLGIPVDLDKYDYIVEGNPLRKEYTVYWRKDIVYSAEYPDYWYYTVNDESTFIQNMTRGHLPEGGYRVRNKEKEQEIRRQMEAEEKKNEEMCCAGIFTNLKDPQGEHSELEMLLRMEDVLKEVAPEYRIEADEKHEFHRVMVKRKHAKKVHEVVCRFRSDV